MTAVGRTEKSEGFAVVDLGKDSHTIAVGDV